MKILVVEDDFLLRKGLEKALLKEGYAVDSVETKSEAMRYLKTTETYYSAILLDLGLPDGNGLTLLQDLRRAGDNTPILIITARSELDDRIEGLDAGADDYLLKPFELAELYARLRAVIRRHCGVANNQLVFDDFILNLTEKIIIFNSEKMDLTLREYAILSRLLLKYRKIVPREQLLQDLYSWEDALGSNTLDVYIHRLRQKVGKDRIQTIRGMGYQLAGML